MRQSSGHTIIYCNNGFQYYVRDTCTYMQLHLFNDMLQGHCWTGTLPHHHHLILQRSHGMREKEKEREREREREM